MVNFPQLPRLKRQSVKERESGELEIWQPTCQCFCCHDFGYVQASLVRLIVPDYDPDKDLIPICQRCEANERWEHPDVIPSFDQRFTREICEQLHQYDRANWREWARKKQEGHNDSIFYREPFHSEGVNCEGTTVKKKGFPIKNKDIFSGKVDENKVIDFSTVVKSLRKRSRSQQEQELAQRNHLEERAK